jgi:hypothetical protein
MDNRGKRKSFTVSRLQGWIGRCEKRNNVVYETVSGESRSVDPETVEAWKSCQLLLEIEGYNLCDIV